MSAVVKHAPTPVNDLMDWLEAGFPLAWRPPAVGHHLRIEEFVDDDTFVLRAELPGIDPARDVEIEIGDGRLTISGERREEHKEKTRREFHYGSFSRTVSLPAGIQEEDVTATYVDGVLEVRVPIAAARPQTRKIEVKASAKST
jgi:HSP20 family molecular chaperone IbpA